MNCPCCGSKMKLVTLQYGGKSFVPLLSILSFLVILKLMIWACP